MDTTGVMSVNNTSTKSFIEAQFEEMNNLYLALGLARNIPKIPEALAKLASRNQEVKTYHEALRYNALVTVHEQTEMLFDDVFGTWSKQVLHKVWDKLQLSQSNQGFQQVGLIFMDVRGVKLTNKFCGESEADRMITNALRIFRGTSISTAQPILNGQAKAKSHQAIAVSDGAAGKVISERRRAVRLSDHTIFRTRSGDEFVRMFVPMNSLTRLKQIAQDLQDQLYGFNKLQLTTRAGRKVDVPVCATTFAYMASPFEKMPELIDRADDGVKQLRLVQKYVPLPYGPDAKLG